MDWLGVGGSVEKKENTDDKVYRLSVGGSVGRRRILMTKWIGPKWD